MRYFTYLAEQAFKTSPTGERLFYRSGFWSRPYIIPDAAMEQKLYKKTVWTLRVSLGGLIIGQPLLFVLCPNVLREPYWFLVYFVVFMAVYCVVCKAIFAHDLRGLQRAQSRLRLGSFYGQTAQRHSKTGLTLGFIGCLLFVAAGIWMLSVGANYALGILAIGFFGLCAVAWGYALFIKLSGGEPPNMPDK